MKNGWYRIKYKDDNWTDFWAPNDEIAYIENGIQIKYLNECYHRLDVYKVEFNDKLAIATELTQEEIDELKLEDKMRDFDGVGIA